MAIDLKLALRLANHLTTIPDCPRSDQAIEALADDLRKHATDEAEARWLVNTARETWDEWMGTKGLLDLLQAKRGGRVEFHDPSKPAACPRCQDERWVIVNGNAYRCVCAGGNPPPEGSEIVETTAEKVPSPPPSPRRAEVKRITQADLDAVVEQRKKERVQ